MVWIVTVLLTSLMYLLLTSNEEITMAKEGKGEGGKLRSKTLLDLGATTLLKKENPDSYPNLYLPRLEGKSALKVTRNSIQNLGVMVDATVEYFPIFFLERLIDAMALMKNFNVIQLRLTGDVEFTWKPRSHPELATSSHAFYTTDELKGLVNYATKQEVQIIPEVNIPSHAGSWGPSWTVPCPNYACNSGWNVPLDLSNSGLMALLRDLITELMEVFPQIHLGGDEVYRTLPCYREAGLPFPSYDDWEDRFKTEVLDPAQIDPKKIIRWYLHLPPDGWQDESVDDEDEDEDEEEEDESEDEDEDEEEEEEAEESEDEPSEREGVHSSDETTVETRRRRLQSEGESSIKTTASLEEDKYATLGYAVMHHGEVASAFRSDKDWNSTGLDAAEASVLELFTSAQASTNEKPYGLMVLTEGLGLNDWEKAGIWTKMVAITMGTSNEFSQEDFFGNFQQTCYGVLDDHMCSTTSSNGQTESDEVLEQRRERVCDRLTVKKEVLRLRDHSDHPGKVELSRARQIFKHRLKTGKQKREIPTETLQKNGFGKFRASTESYPAGRPNRREDAVFHHRLGHTGVTIDTTRSYFPVGKVKELVETLGVLGFNTLHMRISGDQAFVAKLRTHPNLALSPRSNGPVYTSEDLEDIVHHAHRNGVEVIPELNILSRAGGWFESNFVVPCPQHICDVGQYIPLNLTHAPVMAIVTNVLDELRHSFNSPFIHFGHDERKESIPCFEEAQMTVSEDDFNTMERNLMTIMTVLGIPAEHTLRWQSSEPIAEGRQRAGGVTHFLSSNPDADEPDPFFVSTNLDFEKHDDEGYSIYEKMREYSDLDNVLGVLASTLDMSPAMWNGRNVEGKLIAMAIGASTLDKLTEAEFTRTFKKTCTQLHLEGDLTKTEGKSRWTSERFEQEIENHKAEQKEMTCSRLTVLAQERDWKQ